MPNSVSKTKLWNKVRAKLKVKFLEWGITTCELRYKGCWVNNALGFAHRYKRALCDEQELYIVVLACNSCHGVIEGDPDMWLIVTNKVNERNAFLRLRGYEVEDVPMTGPKHR